MYFVILCAAIWPNINGNGDDIQEFLLGTEATEMLKTSRVDSRGEGEWDECQMTPVYPAD